MSLNQLISVSQEIRTLSAAQLFYRAGSRQVLKIHSKRKFSNWHYINEAERGLPCDCEKVQRWVRNIYFGDQRSRSEAGRGVSLSYSHKWKYYFLFQINTLVRILYFRSRVKIKLRSRMGHSSLYVRYIFFTNVTKTCQCYGLAYVYVH
jgi:hypothetical protein